MEIVYQYMNNGAWVNDFREVYNYNGDVTTILLWDWNGNNWTSDELYTYTHSTGSIELLIQYMQGGAWQNDEKQRFTLDFDENVTEILVQDWQNNTWVNDEKTTYHYEGGVYTSMLVEEWSNGVWNEEYKYNFTYVDGNATHGECLEYVGNQWVAANGDMEMAYNYNEGKNTYYGVEVDVVYFDVTSVGENAQVTDVIVYPNPANEVLTIQADDFQKVEMYSLTGQKVLESTSSTLNVGELQSGVYLLKVYGLAGRIATQHIVVK